MWDLFDYINTTWLWWTITIAYVLVVFSVICVVVSENRNPVKSLAWVTVLLVVPAVGLLLYLFFGRNIQSKRIISRRNRRKLKKLIEQPRYTGPHPRHSQGVEQVVNLVESLQGSPFYSENTVEIFNNGTDKFNALLADIAAATDYINLQYYIIADDKIGRRVADALKERARAGVKVRLIYDSVGSFKMRRKSIKALRKAGIEAYPFFEVVFPPFGTRVNWRNHRKLVIIDGVVGYIGGMNIADRYIDGGKAFDVWRDLHLRVRGPGVSSLQQSFAVDWNFMGQPLLEQTADRSEIAGRFPDRLSQGIARGVDLQLLTGGPVNLWMNLTLTFQKIIATARKTVYLQTPYFLPSEGLLHALQIAALSKVDVRIMLPRKSDSDMLRWASFSYIQECLRAGIKVYLYEKGMLHSKALMVDEEFASIGSTNFDFRSFEHNFEANMMIYSRDFNALARQQFLEDQRDCVRITSANWRQRPALEKGLESFMRLFAPIL